jgi:hypothetical protein|nr:MAG TPA: hypothetical protein [Caudoviricetes sp.]
MKYKLLKDTPTIKAGTIFEEIVNMSDETRELTVAVPGEDTPQDPQFTIQDIDNFDEWFEEIKEPTDSAHWKPKIAEKYFYINEYGDVEWEVWNDDDVDNRLMAMGLVYRTEEECERARERKLAEVRLRQTSNFKPDFKNGKGGWAVYYDHGHETLAVCELDDCDAGEPVRYATREEAKKSIEENEQDWKIYFGIKEEE